MDQLPRPWPVRRLVGYQREVKDTALSHIDLWRRLIVFVRNDVWRQIPFSESVPTSRHDDSHCLRARRHPRLVRTVDDCRTARQVSRRHDLESDHTFPSRQAVNRDDSVNPTETNVRLTASNKPDACRQHGRSESTDLPRPERHQNDPSTCASFLQESFCHAPSHEAFQLSLFPMPFPACQLWMEFDMKLTEQSAMATCTPPA